MFIHRQRMYMYSRDNKLKTVVVFFVVVVLGLLVWFVSQRVVIVGLENGVSIRLFQSPNLSFPRLQGVPSRLAPLWLVWCWVCVCVPSCFYFHSGGKCYPVYTDVYRAADLTGFRHLFFFWYWQTAPGKKTSLFSIKHERKRDFRNAKEPKHIFSWILVKVQLEPIHCIGICRNNIVMPIVIRWLLTIPSPPRTGNL